MLRALAALAQRPSLARFWEQLWETGPRSMRGLILFGWARAYPEDALEQLSELVEMKAEIDLPTTLWSLIGPRGPGLTLIAEHAAMLTVEQAEQIRRALEEAGADADQLAQFDAHLDEERNRFQWSEQEHSTSYGFNWRSELGSLSAKSGTGLNEALARLFDALMGLAMCIPWLRMRDDARNEVVEDTLLLLQKRSDVCARVLQADNVEGYLRAVLVRAGITRFRKQIARTSKERQLDDSYAATLADSRVLRAVEILELLESLSEDDFRLITSRYLDGLTLKDIARKEHRSVAWVYARITRIFDQLRSER